MCSLLWIQPVHEILEHCKYSIYELIMKDSCSYFASNTRRVGKSTKVPEHLGISFWWPLRPPPKQRTRNKTTLKTPLGSITGKKFLLSLVLSLHTYVQIKQRQLSLYQVHPSFKTNQSFSLQTQRSIIRRILNYRFIIFFPSPDFYSTHHRKHLQISSWRSMSLNEA